MKTSSPKKCKCGNETNEPDGVCVICKKFKKLEEEKKQEKISAEPEKKKKSSVCKTEGCGRAVQKKGLCYICYKKKYGKPPYTAKKNNPENNSKKKPEKKPEKNPGQESLVVNNNGKLSKLLQLTKEIDVLSRSADEVLNEVVETGNYDTSVMFSIRRKLSDLRILSAEIML